jgi:hypothetical protein
MPQAPPPSNYIIDSGILVKLYEFISLVLHARASQIGFRKYRSDYEKWVQFGVLRPPTAVLILDRKVGFSMYVEE